MQQQPRTPIPPPYSEAQRKPRTTEDGSPRTQAALLPDPNSSALDQQAPSSGLCTCRRGLEGGVSLSSTPEQTWPAWIVEQLLVSPLRRTGDRHPWGAEVQRDPPPSGRRSRQIQRLLIFSEIQVSKRKRKACRIAQRLSDNEVLSP